MSVVNSLISRGLIQPPRHLKTNIHYECMMGSIAYGCSNDSSDVDLYGFSIPPKEVIFPHLNGYIDGFGKQPNKFEQYQEHHIKDETYKKEYDITIYNIVKYFHLVMNNNPNMIDSLFVPRRCIIHSTAVGEHVRENRKLFLTKRAWHTFKGYSYSQLNKAKNKTINNFIAFCRRHDIDYYVSIEDVDFSKFNKQDEKMFRELYGKVHQDGKITNRIETIVKYGYDLKFAYHIVRLLNEVEQILTEHDLDLERNREQLKSIRRGDWSLKEVEDYFSKKELQLEKTYADSTLRYSPDEENLKKLLIDCLEMHYGSIEKAITIENKEKQAIKEIQNILDKIKK